MSGFVPGRDQATLDAMAPEDARRKRTVESGREQAMLDKQELADLERDTDSARRQRKRTLLDRLLRRG